MVLAFARTTLGGMCATASTSSLRAQRSNPESFRGGILDCFVARAPRNDGARGTAVVLQFAVIPRHRVSPSASPMTGSGGESNTPRPLD
ncbi:hypothetical protein EAS61_15580 [Bradyrhizobium zhanjiangense]|uniref:Uncharacterized protein n=1 Tax=Bradyrhizobium zhanjiangense TaxID=1325107 RepID=A0A4Q0QNG0_9BRAD|nr:hypothetical protein EAS61_15580 [Bradyrhizobium zhanjiangense]